MKEPADLTAPDTLVDVSATYGHLPCFRPLLPLIVKVNPHTYLSVRDPADPLGVTWLELAFAGLEALRRRASRPLRSAAIVGTGSGLDAVGISHLFDPERIVASDIHPRALEAARWNIARYCRPETHCEVLESDLFRGYSRDSRFDLIYENLPNVPEGSGLLDGIRAASCYRPDLYLADPSGDRHLLTLHYNCLLQARDHLHPCGWIVCMIGGRVPWPAIRDLFAGAGFTADLLHAGLKTQTEPGIVLEGYARAERNGSPPFAFYHPVAACAKNLDCYRREGADPSGPGAEALSARLEGCRISAQDALHLHRRGEKVCHLVYSVGGRPACAPEARG